VVKPKRVVIKKKNDFSEIDAQLKELGEKKKLLSEKILPW